MVKSSLSGIGEQPLVSVIMNCLNCSMYLREAIDSVLAQTFSNWEIVFWDNASSDGSGDIAQSYDDKRLRYFRGASTVPLGHARNLAIEQSRGELIAFLDCDDLWFPEKLEKQVRLFLADGEVGLVYSDTFFFNEAGMQRRLYEKTAPYRGYRFSELLNNYLISLETAVVRRSALDSLEYWFDEDFSAIEEYDLFVRIGMDWKIDYVPEALAKWRVRGDSLTWREPDSFRRERRVMLGKLQKDPQVRDRYAGELALAWKTLALSDAKGSWKNGNGRKARRLIADSSNNEFKSRLLWIATFLPYNAVEKVNRLKSRAVTPGKQ